jgi:antirestriction protein ArdC
MANVYETVTERIISALDAGIVPWRKEWKTNSNSALPINYQTKKPYRGINVFTLLCSEFSSNAWLTYKQANAMGLQVRKGSKGAPIVFWKFDRKKDELTGDIEVSAFARQYTVFNLDQIDGLPAELPAPDAPVFEPIVEAEGIVNKYLTGTGPALAHGGNRAYYLPSADKVQMPVRESFVSPDAYYSTLFHELTHSTGNASRLKRFDEESAHLFGSESYSKEELIAEFGAAFLCAESGIVNDSVSANHAAYIQGWLRALKNDKSLAIQAAQRAQKAVDVIVSRTFADRQEDTE